MNLADSSAWFSFFLGDKNASFFAEAIENTSDLIVPSISITEVFKRLLREHNENIALEAVAHMEQATIIPLDSSLAINAAHYGVTHKLALADSIAYATAQQFNALLWTQNNRLQHLEGIRYHPQETWDIEKLQIFGKFSCIFAA